MNIIPIAFAFDNNLVFPACVCLSSLLMHAKADTFYDIFILHSEEKALRTENLDKLPSFYSNCRITYRTVDGTFDQAFEIRGITTAAYYRLLIPELIPEYDKIIYSDVDVIFRDDLSEIYQTDIEDYYIAGVDSIAHLIPDLKNYYEQVRHCDSKGQIYSGNLIINSKKILKDNMIASFKEHIGEKYKFQDMDILNIVCKGKIKYLPPSFCLTTYINDFAVNNIEALNDNWSEVEVRYALEKGIVHYNGQKPWKGFCVNFDIWWEYYRKSPFFDEQFYFKFFFDKTMLLESLTLWKRVKILLRFFVYGRYKG
ncbi:MAG: glycosyltransferase family 8 protein [Bacteroidaceae bacterium]|nr:glycosyltransferase family 8 protein [Bacteroidaceae bacterium]